MVGTIQGKRGRKSGLYESVEFETTGIDIPKQISQNFFFFFLQGGSVVKAVNFLVKDIIRR